MKECKSILWRLIAHFEGCYLTPYRCSAGVPTIGIGTTVYPDGRRVSLTDRAITKEEAEKYAWVELDRCISAALKYSPLLADDPARLAAISSFIYNLGAGAYRSSTLRKRINEEDWNGAKAQIKRWNRAGGVVLRGLTRRQAEASLL